MGSGAAGAGAGTRRRRTKLLITRYLPGALVQGQAEEWRPDTYRQAGVLLVQLHGQLAVQDPAFEAASRQKALDWHDARHRIALDVVARLRPEVESWDTPSVISVPTHGDWQPCNWLMSAGHPIPGSRAGEHPPDLPDGTSEGRLSPSPLLL